MRWEEVAFLHWRCPPDALAGRLPAGVALDLRDEEAWVSAVAFTMRRIRVAGLPAWPEVPELNLRAYAVHAGRPGIVFLAIDAPRGAALLGRTQAVPYRSARVDVALDGIDSRPLEGPRFAARWRPGREVDGSVDRFLTERYCAWTARRGHLARADVEHAPFPLQAAKATVTAWGSLPGPLKGRQPDLAHWSPGVAVACGPVRRVKASPAPPQA
jgi:uncharacterized protein YqjF (DUF2071 family)